MNPRRTTSRHLGARSALLTLALAVALLAIYGVALAAEDLTVSVGEVDLRGFPQATAIVQVGGADSASFEPDDLKVLVDGSLRRDAILEPTDTAPVPNTTALLIDESGSMKGAPIAAAVDATGRFVGSIRDVDRVGIFAFDEEFRVLQSPTSDREALKAAIGKLEPRRETALYDAVLRSLTALEDSGTESTYLVVLSDGGDTASSKDLDEALARARASNVQIYTVGLMGNEFDSGPLQKLAEATGGRYLEAPSVSALGTLYSSLAREIQNQFRLSLTLDEAKRGSGSGQLTLKVLSEEAKAEVSRGFFYPATPVTTAPPKAETTPAATPLHVPPVKEDTWVSSFIGWGGSDYTVATLVFVLLMLIGYLLIGALMPKRNVLAEYTDILDNRRNLGPQASEGMHRRPGEAIADRLVRWRGYDDPLQQRIEAAGWQLRTSEFVLFHVVGLVFLITSLMAIGLPSGLALLLGAIGAVGPLALLDYKARRRREAFEGQVPETLLMMAGSFRAGQSFEQAMQVVAAEGSNPTATEFKRVLAQQRLGVTPEVALRTLADRMQSEAFDWVVMVTIIQRQVGGNLAEVYENIAHTLRERVKLNRLVKTLTAEGRLSAIILIALPFIVALLISVLNPQYLQPIYTTTAGYIMLSLAAFGIAAGVIWMRQIIRLGV